MAVVHGAEPASARKRQDIDARSVTRRRARGCWRQRTGHTSRDETSSVVDGRWEPSPASILALIDHLYVGTLDEVGSDDRLFLYENPHRGLLLVKEGDDDVTITAW